MLIPLNWRFFSTARHSRSESFYLFGQWWMIGVHHLLRSCGSGQIFIWAAKLSSSICIWEVIIEMLEKIMFNSSEKLSTIAHILFSYMDEWKKKTGMIWNLFFFFFPPPMQKKKKLNFDLTDPFFFRLYYLSFFLELFFKTPQRDWITFCKKVLQNKKKNQHSDIRRLDFGFCPPLAGGMW